MNKNLVKCKGVGLYLHENTILNFNGVGMVLRVSLNISPEIAKLLPPSKIKKGEQMNVYFSEYHIPSKYIDVFNVQYVHDCLLKKLMQDIRLAKAKYYQLEADNINVKPLILK